MTVEEREEKISGWLEVKFSTSSRMYVSHETIYRTLAHSSPRRAQEGIASAFEIAPNDAALSKLVPTWQGQGADPRRHLDPRAPGRSARPCGARSLGGRLADGLEEQADRYAGAAVCGDGVLIVGEFEGKLTFDEDTELLFKGGRDPWAAVFKL